MSSEDAIKPSQARRKAYKQANIASKATIELMAMIGDVEDLDEEEALYLCDEAQSAISKTRGHVENHLAQRPSP